MMSNKIKHIDASTFNEKVVESNKPVIVDFYSDDCAPCEVLAPIYENLEKKYGDYIEFVKIHRQNNRDFSRSLDVNGSPTVLFFKDGKEVGSRLNGFMTKPQVRKTIEDILGDVIPKEPLKRVDCDVLILGSGPAGMAAAIYASRAKKKTVVLDENVPGGQAGSTYHIANYPGTPGTITGKELVKNIQEQAESFGAVIEPFKEIFEVNLMDEIKYVKTEDTEYFAKSVIIASGSKPRSLQAEFAEDFKGRGVHYCATCDGSMYEGRKVVVIGGGNSAVEEAVYLTRFSTEVTIIHRRDSFRASQQEQEQAMDNPKIKVIWNSEVERVNGLSYSLKSVTLKNVLTKEISEYETEGAFVYIGNEPMSELYEGQLKMDESGFIIAGEDTKTNIDGVFVAGDIRTKAIRQVVTATSDGAIAAIMAEKYISKFSN